MTEPSPTDFDPLDAALPGLEPSPAGAGTVERAARQTIAALNADRLLDNRHAVMTEALVVTARQLDRAVNSSKAKDYGVAELVSQLRETYKVLVPDQVEGGGGDAWSELVAEFQRSGAQIRDSHES